MISSFLNSALSAQSEDIAEEIPSVPHPDPISPEKTHHFEAPFIHAEHQPCPPSKLPFDKSEVLKPEQFATLPPRKIKVKNKKVASLINRWIKIDEEVRLKEEKELRKQRETPEEKNQREIEQWKMQQIQNGSVRKNPNLLPLGPRLGSSVKHF